MSDSRSAAQVHDRSYLERKIETVRNHRDADNCWPSWANIFADEIERLWAENERLRNYVAVIASGMPREDLLAIEREFGEPVDGRLPS